VRLRWTIKYAAGDFNHDEIVDDADARDLMWALGGQSVTSEYHATFDLRADGRIDQNDFNLFTAAYNQVLPDFSGACLE
jgi:hypothetical protein